MPRKYKKTKTERFHMRLSSKTLALLNRLARKSGYKKCEVIRIALEVLEKSPGGK